MKKALEAKNKRDAVRLIRLREVMAITGLSRSYVYELAKQGKFPQSVKLSEKSVAWIEAEVKDWVDQRIAERNMGVA